MAFFQQSVSNILFQNTFVAIKIKQTVRTMNINDEKNAASHDEELNVHEFFRKLLSARDGQIRLLVEQNNALRQQLAAQKAEEKYDSSAFAQLQTLQADAEKLRVDFAKERANLQSQTAAANDLAAKLRDENNNLRYLVKPPKKRGFAWGTAIAACSIGLVFGFFAMQKWAAPKSMTAAAVDQYREKRLFQFEYDINQGNFENVEAILAQDLDNPAYASLKSELEFLRKVTRASKRTFAEAGGKKTTGYVSLDEQLQPKAEPIAAAEIGKKKTLTIAHDVPVSVRAEATTTAEALRKVEKGQICTIVDRTLTRDKVRTTIDGQRYELRDYWYKVEIDGQEGWVFGHFTSKSHNQKYLLDSDGKPVTEILAAPPTMLPAPVSRPDSVRME